MKQIVLKQQRRARPGPLINFRVKDGCGRQADATAGLPQLRQYPCVPGTYVSCQVRTSHFVQTQGLLKYPHKPKVALSALFNCGRLGQGSIRPARVSLDETQMQVEGKLVNLSPGMAVTVEIKDRNATRY